MKAKLSILVRQTHQISGRPGAVEVTTRLDRIGAPRGEWVELSISGEGEYLQVAELSPTAARWLAEQLVIAAHAIDGNGPKREPST